MLTQLYLLTIDGSFVLYTQPYAKSILIYLHFLLCRLKDFPKNDFDLDQSCIETPVSGEYIFSSSSFSIYFCLNKMKWHFSSYFFFQFYYFLLLYFLVQTITMASNDFFLTDLLLNSCQCRMFILIFYSIWVSLLLADVVLTQLMECNWKIE